MWVWLELWRADRNALAARAGALLALGIVACVLPGFPQNTPLSSPGSEQALIELTLQQAIALAEKNDPALLAAALETGSAVEDARQARAARYPSLSGRSEYLGTEGNGKIASGRFVTNDGVHVYREWAVVHQDFSPSTLAGTAVRRAAALQARARSGQEIARRGLVATVTKDYYAAIATRRKYSNAAQALDEARHSLQIAEELERGREAARSDVVKAELQETAQEQAAQEAKLADESARLDLAVLLFRDFNDRFKLADDLDTLPDLPKLADAEALASRSNPALAAAFQTLRACQLDTAIARQAQLPTLTVDAIYGIEANAVAARSTVAAFKETGPVPNLGYFITASLNIPVWDWGIRRSRIQQAELKESQAKVELSAAQRSSVRNLRQTFDEAQLARNQIDRLKRAVALAAESLRLYTLRYQAGESTILELVDAQTSSIQARNTYDDGLVRYRIAIASLQTLTGTF